MGKVLIIIASFAIAHVLEQYFNQNPENMTPEQARILNNSIFRNIPQQDRMFLNVACVMIAIMMLLAPFQGRFHEIEHQDVDAPRPH